MTAAATEEVTEVMEVMEVMEVVMEEAMEVDLETHLLCYQDCKAQSPTTDQSSCATLEIQKLQDLSCCEQRY